LGVEQLNIARLYVFQTLVNPTTTPLGVEQRTPVIAAASATSVNPTTTPLGVEQLEPTVGHLAEPDDGPMAEGGVSIEVTPADPSDLIKPDIFAMPPEPGPCDLAEVSGGDDGDGHQLEAESEARVVASLPAPGHSQSAESDVTEPTPLDPDHPQDDHADGPFASGGENDEFWWG
jgi:hypothetical protein